MKKFINRAEDVVEEMLQGLIVLHPGTAQLAGHKVILRADAQNVRDRQVAILSGGGSGHEPAHAGYIGEGMLSAAVLGEVFTSPSSDAVFAAIKAVAGKAGALLVVKNYTGDRLNFGLAAEMARSEGIPVEVVTVTDDVALKGTGQATGARGLAGTVLIHKLVGAAAAEGKSLAELASLGKTAVESLATMGVSFSAGTSPAIGKPSFELAEHEMELGLGIHGEPGVQRTHLKPADDLTATLLDEILKHGRFDGKKRLAVMVNNLGATTEMELAIVARRTVEVLEGKGFTVERIYAGTFLSSLDMAGISISILALSDERLRWLDADTTAPAWPNAIRQRPGRPNEKVTLNQNKQVDASTAERSKSSQAGRLRKAVEGACQALIKAECDLTELDRITGDGDLGTSMARAARAIKASIDSYLFEDVSANITALGHTLRRELGGSSGPLYGVLFLRCGAVLANSSASATEQWMEALEQGCQAISELGGAKPGDRTMLDALNPFVTTLKHDLSRETLPKALMTAVAEAEQGVLETAQMKPRLGRSSYLGDRVLGHPDPGAKAVAIWLRAAAESLVTQ